MELIPTGFMKKIIIALAVVLFFLSCNDKNKYNVSTDKAYEKNKGSLEEVEKKNPESFLHASGGEKKNLIGQTVIKGEIFNSAKIVTYKDVNIKLSFYSKTGAVMEEDVETIYETIGPGGTKSFKSKYFTPKGTDSVGVKVLGAKY